MQGYKSGLKCTLYAPTPSKGYNTSIIENLHYYSTFCQGVPSGGKVKKTCSGERALMNVFSQSVNIWSLLIV
jgi:hypothetical protein